MKTLKKNKDSFREAQSGFHMQISTHATNIGMYENGTVLSGKLGGGQRKAQSAGRETSWRFVVARADARSGVHTRWLRFTLIVNHIWPPLQMLLCLKWCWGLLSQKAVLHKSQTRSAKVQKCRIYRVILQLH